MKILQVISAGFEQGGAENNIVAIKKNLKKQGHTVKILSSDIKPEIKHFSDYEFKSIPSSGIKKLFFSFFNLHAYKVTKKVLKEFKPDIVLLNTMMQPTASVLFLLKKYPTILFVHGPEIFTTSLLPWYLPVTNYKNGSFKLKDLTFYGKLSYIYNRYLCGLLYKFGLKNVDKMVALSNYTFEFLKKEGYDPIYIPNGAKLLKPTPINSKNPSLLYAGRLEKFKGVDDLIKALSIIKKQIPSITLTIAGTGSYEKNLIQLTHALKLQNSINFLGHLNQKQLAEEYKKCTILVMPSTWPETFGKVGIEAMSVGRPVIATNVGGVKDWLIDGINGMLVEPHRPDQIAMKVIKILTNERLLKSMVKSGQMNAKKFSIENHVNHLKKFL